MAGDLGDEGVCAMETNEKELMDVLHAARRSATAQLAFMPIASEFRSDARAAAAVLRDTTPTGLIAAVARRGAAQGSEADMRAFLLDIDNIAVSTEIERSLGTKPLKDAHCTEVAAQMDAVRAKSDEYNALRRNRDSEAMALAQAESAYYLAATILVTRLSDLSRKGYDVSRFDNQIAKEHLLERFDSMRLPMWRSLMEPGLGRPTKGMGL